MNYMRMLHLLTATLPTTIRMRLARVATSLALALILFGAVCAVLRGLGGTRIARAQVITDSDIGQRVHSILNIDASQFPTITADVYLVNSEGQPHSETPDPGLFASLLKRGEKLPDGVNDAVPVTINDGILQLPRRLVVVWDVVDTNPTSFQEICLGLREAFGKPFDNEQIAVITTTDGMPNVAQTFTANNATLQAVTAKAQRATSTRSEMYDALMLALSQTQQIAFPSSRAIIVVSDEGGDWRPGQTAIKPISNVVSRAHQLGVPIHLMLYKPGPYSPVMSKATASTGGLQQVLPAKREAVVTALQDALLEMNKGFFRLTMQGNPKVVAPGITHTLALVAPSAPNITATRDFVHSNLIFAVNGIAPDQIITQATPLSLQFALNELPFPLNEISVNMLQGAASVSMLRSITPSQLLANVWPNKQIFTPTRFLDLRGDTVLQVHVSDAKGNRGSDSVQLVVPPDLVVNLANTPTQLAEYTGFTPTLLVQPAALLSDNRLTVTADIIFADSSRPIATFQVKEGEMLLPLPGERMSLGERRWQVRLRDNFGREFWSDTQYIRINSSPWILTLLKWVAALLGLLAVLSAVMALALWLSRKKAILVFENQGNAACAYELQVTEKAGLFAFDVHHGGYAVPQRYDTELIAEPETGASKTNPPFKGRGPQNGRAAPSPSSTPSPNPSSTPNANAGGLLQSVAQSTDAAASIASGVAGRMGGLGAKIPGGSRIFGEAQDVARDVDINVSAANYQTQRAARMAEQVKARTGGQSSNNPAPGSGTTRRTQPADADETWQPGDATGTPPTAQKARWVRRGPPWWRTPEIAPGQSQEMTLWIRPSWPFVQDTCELVVRSQPVQLAGSHTAPPAAEIKETRPFAVPMRHGLVWIVLVVALLAAVVWGFWLYVWPCLVGNCFGS